MEISEEALDRYDKETVRLKVLRQPTGKTDRVMGRGFPIYLRDLTDFALEAVLKMLKANRPDLYERHEEGYDVEVGKVFDTDKWRD